MRLRLSAPGLQMMSAAVLLAACSGSTRSEPACPPSPFRHSPPLVIAHAGGEGLGPGNTLLAMERSIAAGADVLDADIRMTSDGVIVARHDRDLATSTDGSGNVDELTWAEVQRLDTRPSWAGQPIAEPVPVPTAEQILRSFPDRRVSLEIKQTTPSMAAAVCALLEDTDSFDRVYLSSNEDVSVYETRDRCPQAFITTTDADVEVMRRVRETGEAWCAPSPIGQPPYRADIATAERVAWSHDHGMALYTWTIDDEDELRKVAELGYDGVYTRRPDVARRVFDAFEG